MPRLIWHLSDHRDATSYFNLFVIGNERKLLLYHVQIAKAQIHLRTHKGRADLLCSSVWSTVCLILLSGHGRPWTICANTQSVQGLAFRVACIPYEYAKQFLLSLFCLGEKKSVICINSKTALFIHTWWKDASIVSKQITRRQFML